jgi:4'-phosphopantetheinyl transferase
VVGSESGFGTAGEIEVEVWLAVPGDEPTSALLSATERATADRFHRAADRAAFVAAHALRRRVAGARTGRDPADIAFGNDPCPVCGSPDHGRPVAVGGGTEASLSRTAGLVGVAASAAVVGFDLEAIDRPVALDDLLPALHPAERATHPDRAAALRLWVRKEAYLKGVGSGLGRDPAGVDVRADPPGWRIVDVDAGPDHRAAVAVRAAADARVRVEVRRAEAGGPERPAPSGR